MKTKLIFLLPFLWLLTSCNDSESDTDVLKVSETSFDKVDANGATVTIHIQSNKAWSISSNNSWCVPDVPAGENNGKIKIEINQSRRQAGKDINHSKRETTFPGRIKRPSLQIAGHLPRPLQRQRQ